jgi:hypothetical protein
LLQRYARAKSLAGFARGWQRDLTMRWRGRRRFRDRMGTPITFIAKMDATAEEESAYVARHHLAGTTIAAALDEIFPDDSLLVAAAPVSRTASTAADMPPRQGNAPAVSYSRTGRGAEARVPPGQQGSHPGVTRSRQRLSRAVLAARNTARVRPPDMPRRRYTGSSSLVARP